MSYNEHSAEVAEDYRLALEDLTMNSRYEITNLTVVARENTEHALAISEALQEHIKKVAPQRKLPALYVLDSIVKNVGTPYTLFFGRKLYQTFMDAYALVDNVTRRKMDEMLKTWKEPVPGSIDTRPVFPPDVVRPIENALIKARTTAIQAQQESMRGQHQLLSRGRLPIPYRDTPTPPNARPSSYQAAPYGQPPPPFSGTNGNHQGNPTAAHQPYPAHANGIQQPQLLHRSSPQPGPMVATVPATAPVTAYPQPGISIDKLNDDIEQLIVATKAEFAQSPLDTSIQTRLRALLDLQGLLQSQRQNLHQEQLVLIENQVTELAVNMRAPKSQARTHTPTPVVSQQPTPVPPVAGALPPPVSAAPAHVSLDSLFGQGALATLLAGARNSATPQPTPQPTQAAPAPLAALRSPQPRPPAVPAKPTAGVPSDPTALMAMLRQSGLLPPTSGSAPPAGASAVAPPPPPPAVSLPPSLTSLLSPAKAGLGRQAVEDSTGEIQLKASSLKQHRPHLISRLYGDLGPPCTQCGRRFSTDEEGRRKKTAHMDWHFRVHQRIAEAEKRGQHRSWYVDATEWIKSRETIDADYVAPQAEAQAAGGGTGAGAAREAPKLQYIPVPEDSQTNTMCPICQEKFEMKWLDEAQEWVWMDAVRVGTRVYHASCHSEATRDREATPGFSRGTPEPVLGKRKAEGDHAAARGKIKLEGSRPAR